MVLTHRIHDVKGDGNCFFRALWICISGDDDLISRFWASGLAQDNAIIRMRHACASALMADVGARQRLRSLWTLIQGCPSLLSDFPVLEKLSPSLDFEFAHFRCAQEMCTAGVWVSEIEVRLAASILGGEAKTSFAVHQNHLVSVALLILDAPSLRNAREEIDIELQLAAQLRDVTEARCVVLCRVGDNHYWFMSLSGDTIIDTAMFKEHIDQFLESDDE
jgi:hypothetical protein